MKKPPRVPAALWQGPHIFVDRVAVVQGSPVRILPLRERPSLGIANTGPE